MHNLKELKIWIKSMELVKKVYLLIPKIPKDEKYGLIDQIKRCAISIPSNIAEGAGRNSKKEFAHFLGIANGSSFELYTQIKLLESLNLIDSTNIFDIYSDIEEIQKMIYSFKKMLFKSNSHLKSHI